MQPPPPVPAHQIEFANEHDFADDGPHPHCDAPNANCVVQPWLPDSKSHMPNVHAVGVWGTVGVYVFENVGVGVRVGVNVGDSVFDTVYVCVTVGVRVSVDDPYGLIGPHETHTASMYVPSVTVEHVPLSDVNRNRTYCVFSGIENATFCQLGPFVPEYGPHAVVHVDPFGEICTDTKSLFTVPPAL